MYITFIYWPLYFLSGFIKRNPNLWLISSYNNFSDNSKYFYLFNKTYLKEKYNINLVWLAQNKISNFNFKSVEKIVYKKTLKGLYYNLIASVYISSFNSLEFINELSRKVYKVNLWHGVGIKNLNFKSTVEPLARKVIKSKISKYLYPKIYIKSNLFLSTSHLMTNHFSECFRLEKKHFYISEYPRCKPLLMEKNELELFINKNEFSDTIVFIQKLKKFTSVFIYMPTWRDLNPNFIIDIGINWEEINNILVSRNFCLILKAHPASNIDGLNSFSNIFLPDKKLDIYPLLPYTDCLITDYSSIYFDYLLTNKNIALFTFDYDDYMQNNRDFAYPYDENMIGYKINTINEFHDFFKIYNDDLFISYKEKLAEIKKRFWTEDVDFIEFIEEIIKNVRCEIKR